MVGWGSSSPTVCNLLPLQLLRIVADDVSSPPKPMRVLLGIAGVLHSCRDDYGVTRESRAAFPGHRPPAHGRSGRLGGNQQVGATAGIA